MNEPLPLEQPQRKSQRGMWIVAGCLAAFLVLYHTWGGKKKKTRQPPAPRPVATAPTVRPETNGPAPLPKIVNWPAIPFEDLIQYNPFQAQPSSTDQSGGDAPAGDVASRDSDDAEVEAVAQALEESRRAKSKQQKEWSRNLASADWKVRMLFHSPQGKAALIGERVVHVGDPFDGYRVVAIEADGVILEPMDEDDSASSPTP